MYFYCTSDDNAYKIQLIECWPLDTNVNIIFIIRSCKAVPHSTIELYYVGRIHIYIVRLFPFNSIPLRYNSQECID